MCSVLHSLTKQETQTGGGGIQYDDKSRRVTSRVTKSALNG